MSKAIEEANIEEIQVEELLEKPYTLRDLKDRDLFPLLQILKKIGIKDFKDAFFQVASGEKSLKEVGVLATIDMAGIMIGNLGKAEEEIYSLWADISGIPAEEIKEMEFGTLPMMIVDTFKGVKNATFFKVLSKLLA
jgi:hypothetical protein